MKVTSIADGSRGSAAEHIRLWEKDAPLLGKCVPYLGNKGEFKHYFRKHLPVFPLLTDDHTAM
jgi:hypothetical protein